MFARLAFQRVVFLVAFVLLALTASLAHAACSTYRSPQKVWFNEYYFGVGSNSPPNFLELYSTSPAFLTLWHGSTVEVYSAANTKKTYTFDNTTATACTISGKTWITSNILSGLQSQQALVILRDPNGDTIDAFVFDNQAPPAPWQSATATWAPGNTTGCAALDTALSAQAAAATVPSYQENMLILSNYGNKDLSRTPDGGSVWNLTSNTGAGTTYTQCTSNNANLTKTVDNTTPPPSGTVTFTLSLANTGNSSLTGITLDDYLPDYTYAGSVAPTYVSAIPTNLADVVTTTSYATVDPNPIVSGTPTNTPATATKITWAPAAITAGTTATLNIKMQLSSNAVPGYVYRNIAQTTGGLTPNQIDFVDFTIGSPFVGSFVITVSPATASTCTPALLGPKVTITAMTGPNGTGVVDTAYTGSSAGNSVVYLAASSANPVWYNSSGTQITVSPVPIGSFVSGVATFYLTDSTAETITVSAFDLSTYNPNIMQGTSGDITFTSGASGIALTDADTLTPPYGVTAGRPHKVRATISQCGVTATTRTGTYSGTIKYTPGLNHPTGASAPTISTTASCPGAIGPLSTSGTSSSLTFTSGLSDFYLCTTDVGQFALEIAMNLTSPTASVSGGSGNFTVRPFVITASGFASGINPNPNGSAPTDPVFTSAGTPFSGTFNAWKWRSAEDLNNDGVPDPGVTAAAFSVATHGVQLPRFSGTTNSAGVITFAPKLNTPVGGITGGFIPPSPSPATANSGSVTLSTFTYSEVGSMTIGGADLTGTYGATNYLGMSGLHVPILSDVVGRFVPHHFDTEVANACGTFSYSGQPFPAKITARNSSGVTTQNYTNTFAKNVTFSDSNGTPGSFSPAPLPYSDFLAGVADKTALPYSVSFTFTNKLTAPATIKLHAVDTDSVNSTSGTEGTAPIRSGRLRLPNAYGAETETVIMPARLEYYNGTTFALNIEDSCTNPGGVATYQLDNALETGQTDGTILINGIATTTLTINTTTANAGLITLRFSPPGAGNTGYTDVTALISTTLPWLLYEWDGAGNDFNENPFGRANFGIYRGNDRIINWREIVR